MRWFHVKKPHIASQNHVFCSLAEDDSPKPNNAQMHISFLYGKKMICDPTQIAREIYSKCESIF